MNIGGNYFIKFKILNFIMVISPHIHNHIKTKINLLKINFRVETFEHKEELYLFF